MATPLGGLLVGIASRYALKSPDSRSSTRQYSGWNRIKNHRIYSEGTVNVGNSAASDRMNAKSFGSTDRMRALKRVGPVFFIVERMQHSFLRKIIFNLALSPFTVKLDKDRILEDLIPTSAQPRTCQASRDNLVRVAIQCTVFADTAISARN